MTTFVFRLKPPRATFALDMTDEEREIMGRHAAYWQRFIDSGRWWSSGLRTRRTCAHSPPATS